MFWSNCAIAGSIAKALCGAWSPGIKWTVMQIWEKILKHQNTDPRTVFAKLGRYIQQEINTSNNLVVDWPRGYYKWSHLLVVVPVWKSIRVRPLWCANDSNDMQLCCIFLHVSPMDSPLPGASLIVINIAIKAKGVSTNLVNISMKTISLSFLTIIYSRK